MYPTVEFFSCQLGCRILKAGHGLFFLGQPLTMSRTAGGGQGCQWLQLHLSSRKAGFLKTQACILDPSHRSYFKDIDHSAWALEHRDTLICSTFFFFLKGCYLWHQNVAPERVQMGEDSWWSKGISNQEKYCNEVMFAEEKTFKQNY